MRGSSSRRVAARSSTTGTVMVGLPPCRSQRSECRAQDASIAVKPDYQWGRMGAVSGVAFNRIDDEAPVLGRMLSQACVAVDVVLREHDLSRTPLRLRARGAGEAPKYPQFGPCVRREACQKGIDVAGLECLDISVGCISRR